MGLKRVFGLRVCGSGLRFEGNGLGSELPGIEEGCRAYEWTSTLNPQP